MGRPRVALTVLACALAAGASAQTASGARTNYWSDPFANVTAGLPACPVPAGPLMTDEQALAESHARSQRGVSCYLSGRCRLANSYLYDKEIIPRVKQLILGDGRFERTSLWLLGQRRMVWLMGCVASEADRQTLETLVRNVDDVEAVIDELMVGTGGQPAYEVAAPLDSAVRK